MIVRQYLISFDKHDCHDLVAMDASRHEILYQIVASLISGIFTKFDSVCLQIETGVYLTCLTQSRLGFCCLLETISPTRLYNSHNIKGMSMKHRE